MGMDLGFELNAPGSIRLLIGLMLVGLDVNASLRFPAHHEFTRS
jgi:hypothetical protein